MQGFPDNYAFVAVYTPTHAPGTGSSAAGLTLDWQLLVRRHTEAVGRTAAAEASRLSAHAKRAALAQWKLAGNAVAVQVARAMGALPLQTPGACAWAAPALAVGWPVQAV